ncbi:MAG TPA: DUF2244 domain-containing protein [Geminicoccaceae bacterium]|nr:DUF2244 domain-containing protein [Geminicoccaceae bacterium]
MTDESPDPRRFEAVLYPNPPLGRCGFIILMGAVVIVSAGMGAAFALAGAWPVSGFMGIDVVLLYLAFRACQRQSRRVELIRLDHRGLRVRRLQPDGQSQEWLFEPYWVRVNMDDPPRRDSFLTLSAHGRHLCIGSFLTPEERLGLARALQDALRAYR